MVLTYLLIRFWHKTNIGVKYFQFKPVKKVCVFVNVFVIPIQLLFDASNTENMPPAAHSVYIQTSF